MSERICAEISTLDRVELLLKGDVSGVEQITRKISKSRYSLKSFGKWEPRNSWQCDFCMLSGFDRDIQWKVCSNCQKRTHVFCQVSSEEEFSYLNKFTCLSCQGATSHDQIRERIANKIDDLNRLALLINVELVTLKKEESSLKQKCVKFMGATRLRTFLKMTLRLTAQTITLCTLLEITVTRLLTNLPRSLKSLTLS